jgi:hypothetical protein
MFATCSAEFPLRALRPLNFSAFARLARPNVTD